MTVGVALDHYLGYIDEMLTQAGWGTFDIVAGLETHHIGIAGARNVRLTARP